MNNEIAVVTFSDGAGDYHKKAKRLVGSLPKYVDALWFKDYKEIGSPTHKENPYAFKVYAIRKAIEMGYSKVLWCDSPLVYQGGFERLENIFDKYDFFAYDNIGFSVGDFTNIKTKQEYGYSNEEYDNMPMIMACFMGFDFSSGLANNIFKEYTMSMEEGDFIGDWKDHRHDQSCMSIIMNTYLVKPLNPFDEDSIFCYREHIDKQFTTSKGKVFLSV